MLDLQEFRAWLCSHEPHEVVGWARIEYACPIATWLTESRGGWWRVDGTHIRGPGGEEPLPGWAWAFISHLDMYHSGPALRAGEALQMLEVAMTRTTYERKEEEGNDGKRN